MTDTETQEQQRAEQIVISLRKPMYCDVAIRLMRAINREFPGARWLPGDEQGNLVIEVDAAWLDEIDEDKFA